MKNVPALLGFLVLAPLAPVSLAGSSCDVSSGSAFAGWDCFTCPDTNCAPNSPDMAGSDNLDARLRQLVGGAIITASCNIYHPGAATSFVLDDVSAVDVQGVELVLTVDGTLLDQGSIVLEFDSEVRFPTISGSNGTFTCVWDLDGEPATITSYAIHWSALGAHMSLDSVELTLSAANEIGQSYCTSGTNSSGMPAVISAVGSTTLSDDSFCLRADGVPSQIGLFFHATNATQIPFGNGVLCANGNITRGQLCHASNGTVSYAWPTASLTAGTKRFQYWFRDPAAGGAFFDTSDAIAITFE
jgi:hypothetical protein